MRQKILRAWGKYSAGHPWQIAGIALILIILAILSASKLSITMQWSDLLPEKDPMVQEFDRIRKDYVGTANSIVVIIGEEQEMKDFAEEIVPQIKNLDQYVNRVNYKIDKDYIRNHALMLAKTKDLRNMAENKIFSDFNLSGYLTHTNDNFEDVYIGDETSLSDKEKEDNAIVALDGIEYWIKALTEFTENENVPDSIAHKSADMLLMGDPYYISYDKRMLLVIVEPSFDIIDIDACVASTDSIQAIVDRTMEKYPSIYAGLTGTIPLSRDEMIYSERDMKSTSIIAFTLVMLLFIFSFRMITAPVLAGLNLIISVIFAAGVVALFVDSLNMMTSMFAVILIGLGVDFSIHIISLYYERRAAGDDISKAISSTLARSGAGIVTGAATTAIAFLTLMISQTKGIKEMGLVLGVGILAVMLMTVFFLPSLLIIRERLAVRFLKTRLKKPRPVEFSLLGSTGGFIKRKPIVTLTASLAISIVMLIFALNSKFDYNYLNMEPKGLPSVALQDSMLAAFDLCPDFVMVTSSTVDGAREIADDAKKLSSVSMVESISNFMPSQEQQSERMELIGEIQEKLETPTKNSRFNSENLSEFTEQLNRLDMNIYEIGQMAFIGGQDKVDAKCKLITGDPEVEASRGIIIDLINKINNNADAATLSLNKFQETFRSAMREIALDMANSNLITLDSIPQNIRERYINDDGDRFLVTIYPKEQVWNYKFLARFTEQMERLSEKITGTPPLMLRLIYLIGEDGKIASILAIIVVFLLLWIDFKEIKLALVALVPLIFGAIWMVGMMTMFGLMFTLVNVMAIPMIIGIGIDDGVHLMHRFRIEGWGQSKIVLKSTGRAILLTSLTTMAGFGSLILAKYRGFGSLGSLLVLGVAACFLTSVLFLPSLVNLLKTNNRNSKVKKGKMVEETVSKET